MFSGMMSTPILPFDTEENLALEHIDPFVGWQVNSGVEGFFCLGTWGGFALLTTEERTLASKAWCTAIQNHKAKSIIQVGAFAIQDAENLAKYATDCGANAIASLVPLYYSGAHYYTIDDYCRYFERMVNASSLPLFVYNNPRTTGVLLSPQEFVDLVEIGVKGVKDGSKDHNWISEAQRLLKKKNLVAEIIPGNTSALPYCADYGLEACMSGATVCFPQLASSTLAAFATAKMSDDTSAEKKNALALYEKLMAARELLTSYGHPAQVSYALLKRQDQNLGFARAPWRDVSENSLNQLVEDLNELDVPGFL
jgi:4-hydroxy-tetrahydrodipicolinate synthase